MDIYRFINSKDVAAYLKDRSYEFTPTQAAYLVGQCDDAMLEERMGAWHEILDTMPDETCVHENACDMPFGPQRPPEPRRSLRDLVREDMAQQDELLSSFLDGKDGPYFPYASRWPRRPSWVPDDYVAEHGLWNELSMPVPFSTFDKCKEYLERENDVLVNGWHPDEPEAAIGTEELPRQDMGRYDRHIVCKSTMDEGRKSSYRYIRDPEPVNGPIEYAVLGVNYEVLRMVDEWHPANLESITPGIPVPFVRGDIVIDPADDVPNPFVFCFALPWKPDEETGGSLFDWEACKRVVRKDVVGQDLVLLANIVNWPGWSTRAFGYEAYGSKGALRLFLCGASRNYLNLEYYRGPLTGRLSILKHVSDYLKGEMPLWELIEQSRSLARGAE